MTSCFRLSVLTNKAGFMISMISSPSLLRVMSCCLPWQDNRKHSVPLTDRSEGLNLLLLYLLSMMPELVSPFTAAFWSVACHLSKTIQNDLKPTTQKHTYTHTHSDKDRWTNVYTVTLQAASLHLRWSTAHFKWHRELHSRMQNDSSRKVKWKNNYTHCDSWFPTFSAQNPKNKRKETALYVRIVKMNPFTDRIINDPNYCLTYFLIFILYPQLFHQKSALHSSLFPF